MITDAIKTTTKKNNNAVLLIKTALFILALKIVKLYSLLFLKVPRTSRIH